MSLDYANLHQASEMASDDDSNDDDSDDDEDDKVPAYDPDSQTRPKLPLYHPGFKLTEDTAQEIMSTILKYISLAIKNGYEDGEGIILRNEMMKHKHIPYQEKIQLAVAGDTGAGKSALLNAILGVLNLNIEVCPNR